MAEKSTLSLTDEICSELVAGLKTGDLDWTRFLAKYSGSKGVLYDAIGRFFRDMEPEMRTLNETQAKLDEARLQLESLNHKTKEADKVIQEKNQDIVGLEEKQNTLKKQIEALESNLAQKGETLERLQELEGLDFGKEKLEALHTTLAEMGTKRGFKTEEVGNAFFAELKDYDTKIGFEQELQQLAAVTEAKKVEAEKWRTEAEICETKHKELQGTISVIRSLSRRGVKPEQVVSWNNALIGVGGVEELDKGLNRYGSVEKLLAAKKRERKRLDTKVAELNGKLDTLKQQKAEIEGSIKALRASAVAEIERLGQTGRETLRAQKAEIEGSIKTLKASALSEMEEVSQVGVEKVNQVTQAGTSCIGQVGETAVGELKEVLSLVDELAARTLEVGKVIGQDQAKLNKIKETKEKAEALTRRIEGYKWSN